MRFLFIYGSFVTEPKVEYLKALIKLFEDDGHVIDVVYFRNVNIRCDRETALKIRRIELDTKIDDELYDCLLISKVNSQSSNYITKLAKTFESRKCPILCFKSDSAMEFMPLRECKTIKYGIPSEFYHLPFNHRYIPNVTVPKFECPFLNLVNRSEPLLSKDEFFRYYSLDPDKKIIIFLPGRLDKICRQNADHGKNMSIIYQNCSSLERNFSKLLEIIDHHEFQLITKFHPNQRCHGRLKETDVDFVKMCQSIPHIAEDHLNECLKYSSLAITIGTMMAYELYLYDLPTLELGSGNYFFKWSGSLNTYYQYKPNVMLMKKYNNGKDLVYGHVIEDDEWIDDNFELTLGSFFSKKWDINDFKYKDDHPIYGKSYSSSPQTVYDIIIDNIR